MPRALVNKMIKGGNKGNKKNTPVNPLKFFNDALEFRRMAMGGSMMNMPTSMNIISPDAEEGESSMDSGDPIKKRQRQQRRQARQLRNQRRTKGCSRKRMYGSTGEECSDDMA
jgi:hypothetical protein